MSALEDLDSDIAKVTAHMDATDDIETFSALKILCAVLKSWRVSLLAGGKNGKI